MFVVDSRTVLENPMFSHTNPPVDRSTLQMHSTSYPVVLTVSLPGVFSRSCHVGCLIARDSSFPKAVSTHS